MKRWVLLGALGLLMIFAGPVAYACPLFSCVTSSGHFHNAQ